MHASIKTLGLSLDFPLYGMERSIRKYLLGATNLEKIGGKLVKQDKITIRALNDINIEIHEGDAVGLVGHNGAGKTTLLQVLAGIYEPTHGKIEISGTVAPLFNTNLGIDADDTGLNNIYTTGFILGMNKKEIDKKINEIIEFTELDDYLSLPVRTYSAGMTTRLGFAIATSIDPEILLLDENIGAGDARFQLKAAARVKELMKKSKINLKG